MVTFKDIKEKSISKVESYVDNIFSTETDEEDFRLQRDNAYYRGIIFGLSLLKQSNIYAFSRDILSDKIELNKMRIKHKPDEFFIEKLKEENKGMNFVLETIYEEELVFNKDNNVINSVEIINDEKGNQCVYTNDFNGNREFYGKFKPGEDIYFNFNDDNLEEK